MPLPEILFTGLVTQNPRRLAPMSQPPLSGGDIAKLGIFATLFLWSGIWLLLNAPMLFLVCLLAGWIGGGR